MELTHERKLEIVDLYNKALNSTAVTKPKSDEEFIRSIVGLPELPRGLEAVGTREAQRRDEYEREKRFERAVFWKKSA